MEDVAAPGRAVAASSGGKVIAVRALLLGERLDTRKFDAERLTPVGPATLRRGSGYAVLFRYGAVVMFDLSAEDETGLVEALRPLTTEPYPIPDRDATRVAIRPDLDERVDATGTINIRDGAVERIQVIAHILAKSLVLAHHEAGIAAVFDRIEPLAAALQAQGRVGGRGQELIRQIGTVLRVQHVMVGRVETREKPDMLWDHPELERLYARLAEEYEIKERDQGLDRKLTLISHTVVTLQSLLQSRSSLRLEWYVVLLIVVEIVLSIYSMVLK
jgi:required for meiotic nuclear division protein 1